MIRSMYSLRGAPPDSHAEWTRWCPLDMAPIRFLQTALPRPWTLLGIDIDEIHLKQVLKNSIWPTSGP